MPKRQALRVDVRKARANEARRAVRDVEQHVLAAGALHLEVDGARHDVARRQIGQRVVPLHERVAVRQPQHGALAPQRLAHQEALGLGLVEAPSGGTGRTPCSRPRRPARYAMATPSPVATSGFEV